MATSNDQPKMSERALQNAVLELARLLGWRTAHFRPALTGKGWRTAVGGDGAGFPDCVLVRGSRLVVAELKAARGKLAPAQAEWLAAFRQAGAEEYVWWPHDWTSGRIEACLRGEA